MIVTKRGIELFFSKRRNKIIFVCLLIALVGSIISGILLFSNLSKCNDEDCFKKAMVKCSKKHYTKETSELTTYYSIEGKTSDGKKCEVYVKIMQVKKGTKELSSLVGKEMTCLLPFGVYAVPEEKIDLCSGALKEAIQEIIIQRMHSELVENIGKLNDEIVDVL